MIRFAIALFAATAIAAPLAAAEIQIQPTGPVIELQISETVRAAPDVARVSAGVTTEAPTATQAMRDNAAAMTAVINRLKASGVAAKDIQTDGISLNAKYTYDRPTERQVFRGYSVSNRVTVVLRDVDKAGSTLDALVEAGATDINGPNFSIDDDGQAKAKARAAAMATAKARAMEYANWAGYPGIKLLEVSEAVASRQPISVMSNMVSSRSASESTPVQPGMVGAGVTIHVKYEMTQ
jgi:uncharacterized protein YggE